METNSATITTAPEVIINLDVATVNGIHLGASHSDTLILGVPETRRRGSSAWPSRGFQLLFDRRRLLFGVLMVWKSQSLYRTFSTFKGRVVYNGRDLHLNANWTLSSIVSIFGQPFHSYPDDELVYFYEFGEYEVVISFVDDVSLGTLLLQSPPTLADASARRWYGCNKDPMG